MHKNLIGRGVAVTALALAVGGMAGATEERSALLDAVPCPGYGVLLVHADAFGGVEPTKLANALLADPDVELVDFFNAVEGTPTLAQLEAYDVVFTFSNYSDGYQDPVALGDNLADYLDGGGIVVASFYSLSSVDALAIQGRWLTGGYSPHQPTSSTLVGAVTLGPAAVHPFHPLLSGVRALDAGFRLDAPVALGARRVAVYSDGSSALAVKRRAIGMPVYLGDLENPGTGDYARVIVNAARWLSPRPCRARDDALPGGEVGGE